MNARVIEEAIRTKSVIRFNYGNHERVAEPHVLGLSKGTIKVLCYQIAGSSSSGDLPEWRRFDLGDIDDLTFTGQHFPGPRPIPSGRHSSWDRVILIVAF